MQLTANTQQFQINIFGRVAQDAHFIFWVKLFMYVPYI